MAGLFLNSEQAEVEEVDLELDVSELREAVLRLKAENSALRVKCAELGGRLALAEAERDGFKLVIENEAADGG